MISNYNLNSISINNNFFNKIISSLEDFWTFLKSSISMN